MWGKRAKTRHCGSVCFHAHKPSMTLSIALVICPSEQLDMPTCSSIWCEPYGSVSNTRAPCIFWTTLMDSVVDWVSSGGGCSDLQHTCCTVHRFMHTHWGIFCMMGRQGLIASRNPTRGSGASTGSGAGKPPEFGPILQRWMPQRLQSTKLTEL